MIDIDQSRQMLERALAYMPQDFALSNVRNSVRRALVEMQDYMDKKNKRAVTNQQETVRQKWEKSISTPHGLSVANLDAKSARLALDESQKQLALIEKMIADEKKVIEDMQRLKKSKPQVSVQPEEVITD